MARSAATSFVDVQLSRISSGLPRCFVRNFLRTESPFRWEVCFMESPVGAWILLAGGVGGFSTYSTGRRKPE